MSLDHLNKIINQKRDAAQTVRNVLNQEVGRIRADTTRTKTGKKSLIAGVLQVAQQKTKQLQEEEAKAISESRFNLERKVFGTTITDPTGIIAYRDAQQRADELTAEDHDKAQSMLHAASLSGDHTLASAVLSRALANGWDHIIEGYKSQSPDKGDALNDLLNLDRWSTEDSESFNGSFGAYFVNTPGELRGASDVEVNRLAKADGAPAVITGNGHIWGVA